MFSTLSGIWSAENWMVWRPPRVICRCEASLYLVSINLIYLENWFCYTQLYSAPSKLNTLFEQDSCRTGSPWEPLPDTARCLLVEGQFSRLQAVISEGEWQQNKSLASRLKPCRTHWSCSALSQPPNSTLNLSREQASSGKKQTGVGNGENRICLWHLFCSVFDINWQLFIWSSIQGSGANERREA